MKKIFTTLLLGGLVSSAYQSQADFTEEAAARRYFQNVRAISPKQTPPLTVANTTGIRLFWPSTRGKGISYYMFDTEHLFEIDLALSEVRKVVLPARRKNRGIYLKDVASVQFVPDGLLYFALSGGHSWPILDGRSTCISVNKCIYS